MIDGISSYSFHQHGSIHSFNQQLNMNYKQHTPTNENTKISCPQENYTFGRTQLL